MKWRISLYNWSKLSFQNREKIISVQVRPQCLQNILSNAGVRGGLQLFQCCSLDLVPSTTRIGNWELDDFLVIPNFSAAILSELRSLVENLFVYSWHSFPHRADWPKSDSSDNGEPQGSHGRQNSNFWDVPASSPSFLPHCQSAPERLLFRVIYIYFSTSPVLKLVNS